MEAGLFDKSIGLIIQARMSSTRLPGKVLMPMPFASETTLLGKIVRALKTTGGTVIVATSTNKENDIIEQFCESKGVQCFRGEEDDVFSRFHEIQLNESFSTIFRFTADNPFIDLGKLYQFYNSFIGSGVEYAYSKGMPLGMNFEAVKGDLFVKLNKLELTSEEREHVTLVVHRLDNIKKIFIQLANSADLRMTVDTPIDYAQASLLMSSFDENCSLINILELKDLNPWIFELNKGVVQTNTSDNKEAQIVVIKEICAKNGYNRVVELLK